MCVGVGIGGALDCAVYFVWWVDVGMAWKQAGNKTGRTERGRWIGGKMYGEIGGGGRERGRGT
jgi:hypothetical protein